jgi:hypothetical protein
MCNLLRCAVTKRLLRKLRHPSSVDLKFKLGCKTRRLKKHFEIVSATSEELQKIKCRRLILGNNG